MPDDTGPATRPSAAQFKRAHSTVRDAQSKVHSTVQLAQTEKTLRKSLDSRIQPCYDATIPGGTVECKPPEPEP